MDYEKKYKEALRQAKEVIKYYKERNRDEAAIEDLQEIFPELKESEGDKKKKEIILYLKGIRFTTDECAEQVGKWIAWIEKQSENPQGKSALEAVKEEKVDNSNKVEPKLHESDWLCENEQKTTAWSEEDESRIKQLLGWIDTLKNYIHYDALVSLELRRKRIDEVSKLESWLKSLKDRVQPKQEWSEEDEDYINDLIKHFSQNERLKNSKEDVVL